MRKLLALTLLFNLMLSLLPLTSSISHAQVNPWPWAKPLPFPWDNIQGTWTESSSLFTFSFQVVENSWGDKHIKIRQVDANTGMIIAQGIGYENSDGIVVAGMTGGQQKQYLLTIRLIQNIFCWDQRKVTGVTIESYDHQLIHHFEIYKITEIPLTPDNVQVYKQPHIDSVEISPMCWVEDATKG
jgi:hypothetical protein